MNRHVYLQLILSSMLVWQLGAGQVALASRASGSATVHTAVGHCATQDQSNTESGRHGSAPAHSYSACDAPAGSTDCCKHATCACDCAGTAAVSMTLLDPADIVPDRPAIINFAAPFIEAGVFDFLRPPI